MSLDKAPAPFESDYYVAETGESVRGAVVHQPRTLDASTVQSGPLAKIPQTFADNCIAQALPTDHLYVHPRSRFAVRSSQSAAALGNMLVAGLQSLCPAGTEIRTDSDRMKISVEIPGTLDFKVKFFRSTGSSHIVSIRRDSGDWFIFIQIYSSIKKFLRQNGVDLETIGF